MRKEIVFRVIVDGTVVKYVNLSTPVFNDGPMWASDPFFPAALVQLNDIRYAPSIFSDDYILKLFKARAFIESPGVWTEIAAKNYVPSPSNVRGPSLSCFRQYTYMVCCCFAMVVWRKVMNINVDSIMYIFILQLE